MVMVMVLMIVIIVVVVDNGSSSGCGCGSGSQQCTNPRRQVTQVTKFCTVVPNTHIFMNAHYGTWVHVTLRYLEF